MLETITERIRLNEVLLMSSLQTHLSSFQPLFMFGSHLGDPLNGYIYYSVFAFIFISHSSSLKVLWTAVMSEWINLMLKWIFNDDRPYWWSQVVKEYVISSNESNYFEDFNKDYDLNDLSLKQFDISCETGPGLPSGHVMCSSAVWFCLIIQLIKHKIIGSKNQRLIMRMTFISLLLWVTLGRIYISAHFPDQCFFGIISGIIVAVIIEKLVDIHRLSFGKHLISAMLLISISYLFHEFKNYLSKDSADWSLILAKKYCFDISFVKADTLPLYVVWRTSATLIGIGIAFNLLLSRVNKNNYLSLVRNKNNLNVRIINTIVSTSALIIYVNYSKPEPRFEQIYSFYFKSFIQFLFIPIVAMISILLIDKIMKFYFNRVHKYSKR